MKKLPNLGWASLDARQPVNHGLRFSHRRGRFPTELSFKRLAALLQLAARPAKGHGLQGVHASRDVVIEVRTQRVLRNLRDATNLVVGQATGFQPQCPHLLLNPRVRVLQPFELNGFQRFPVKRDSQHSPRTSRRRLSGQQTRKPSPRVV